MKIFEIFIAFLLLCLLCRTPVYAQTTDGDSYYITNDADTLKVVGAVSASMGGSFLDNWLRRVDTSSADSNVDLNVAQSS